MMIIQNTLIKNALLANFVIHNLVNSVYIYNID